MTSPQPNTPDVSEREAGLVAEIAAWSAMAEVELFTIDKNRELLKRLLALLPRRADPCRFAAANCRSCRNVRRSTLVLVANLEYQLTNLRCDKPLPF
ncbi:TPA: hypothetical protein SIA26_001398 [Aeromonas bestiarum]|nr:hypothetical protein [Aeromonas bestiarum]